MKRRILVVEDEAKTSETIRLYLERDGHEVACVADGFAAIREARSQAPDLVVLDLMLPGLDGRDVCRALRRDQRVPIVMVTSRTTEDDKLAGLELGADDYLTKPFSPRELVARVRAVLRRTNDEVQPTEVRRGALRIDRDRHTAAFAGRELRLTPSEHRILSTLADAPGRVFTRSQLVDRALGGAGEVFERTVDAHVTHLRRKLRQAGAERVVVTVFGVGYKLSEDP